MKYISLAVVLAEIPECISLAINITNCPNNCPGCHSSYLSKNIGEVLTDEILTQLIKDNQGVNCILFMGGDSTPTEIVHFASLVKKLNPDLKTAWYSGNKEIYDPLNTWRHFDYIKVGPYIEKLGPLNSKTTNQRLFKKLSNSTISDITYKFQH